MFKKKCRDCGRKVERGFNFCPYCGMSFKAGYERDDFGMIGRDDSGEVKQEVKMPFGLGKIMNSLVKQLEKQMENADFEEVVMPRAISIQVSQGIPQIGGRWKRVDGRKVEKKKIVAEQVSNEENERRMGLPKIEGKSRVKRIDDRIIYEIEAPGVNKKRDVVVTQLATGLEIRVYTDDKCYVKFIPLKVELIDYSVNGDRVFVELRG